jgi:hypothetical protein
MACKKTAPGVVCRLMSSTIYKDKEIVWFYYIVLGLLGITFLLVVTDRAWLLSLIIVVFILGFAYFGWPLSAQIVDQDKVVFKGLLKKTIVTPESIASVGIVGAHDYRAQLRLRNHHDVQIGYRCRQYDRSSELARVILDIIEQAPKAKINPEAKKLLQQVAKGRNKPLR